jgi:hypothetical protein
MDSRRARAGFLCVSAGISKSRGEGPGTLEHGRYHRVIPARDREIKLAAGDSKYHSVLPGVPGGFRSRLRNCSSFPLCRSWGWLLTRAAAGAAFGLGLGAQIARIG